MHIPPFNKHIESLFKYKIYGSTMPYSTLYIYIRKLRITLTVQYYWNTIHCKVLLNIKMFHEQKTTVILLYFIWFTCFSTAYHLHWNRWYELTASRRLTTPTRLNPCILRVFNPLKQGYNYINSQSLQKVNYIFSNNAIRSFSYQILLTIYFSTY